MNFDGNFKHIDVYDIAALSRKVSAFTEDEWGKMSWKDRIGKEHRETQTIPILFDKDFRHANPSRHSAADTLATAYADMTAFMKRIYEDDAGYFIRMILVRMNPMSEIPLHYDTGASLPYSHRVHLPIATNEKITFQVGDESKYLKQGELWEINNQRRHGVFNRSSDYRIHMIMDWVTSDLAKLRKEQLGLEPEDVGQLPKEDSRN
ncbi:aspartyl/asparaginyl beta-hydroxylase domain-containing protein [Hahella chejuensis]|nr:aspartyl/asparaginyl beta-hydroxylase domain-containing protein [Hahella chejuensis]